MDIEVVIDRLAVNADMKVRLSQSIQKALQVGKDLMFLLLNDENKTIQYSKQLMCEDSGISYEEPSPNSFSFNSPYGACPTCKGLGSVYQVSMEKIIPDDKLSIDEGAIAPLGEARDAFVYKQVQELARKNKFKLDKPVKDLPEKIMNLLLYGKEVVSEEDSTEVDMTISEDAGGLAYKTEYEGIVLMIKRWFSSPNTSEYLREWVEKFMELKTCPTCNGARLKRESLWFKVDEKNIAELSNMNLDKLRVWFEGN